MMYAIGLPGCPARITECEPDRLEVKVRAGEVAIKVDAFSAGRISIDGATFEPHVPGLAERTAERREQAKRIRRKRIGQGVIVDGIGRVQTDAGPGRDSMAAIERLAGRAARAAGPWSVDFKLADNSVVPMSAADMLMIAAVVEDHEAACRAACETILALIDAAADEAALDAIDLTAGYPAMAE